MTSQPPYPKSSKKTKFKIINKFHKSLIQIDLVRMAEVIFIADFKIDPVGVLQGYAGILIQF
jgi:hypothetical protein